MILEATDLNHAIRLLSNHRSRWDRVMIEEGLSLVKRAFSFKQPGSYTLQAGIAALHVEAKSPEATDWAQIVALYTLLLRLNPSPVAPH